MYRPFLLVGRQRLIMRWLFLLVNYKVHFEDKSLTQFGIALEEIKTRLCQAKFGHC
jgi:hypothetical protein